MVEREYISRKEIFKFPGRLNHYDVESLRDFIDNIPAADVAPVKHAHWVYNENALDWGLGAWECSLCHSVNNNLPCDERIIPTIFLGSTYCPNCGAKMDEQEGDEK